MKYLEEGEGEEDKNNSSSSSSNNNNNNNKKRGKKKADYQLIYSISKALSIIQYVENWQPIQDCSSNFNGTQ